MKKYILSLILFGVCCLWSLLLVCLFRGVPFFCVPKSSSEPPAAVPSSPTPLGWENRITLRQIEKDLTFIRKSDIIMLSYLLLGMVKDNIEPFYDFYRI